MKIVIEIDEERYSDVKNQVKNGIDNPLKVIIANGIPLSSSENPNKWIPVKWHEITDEEREREGYPKDWACHLDNIMPYDGQRILITTKGGFVELDECYSDDGCTFALDSGYDWIDDVVAWMPLPIPPNMSEIPTGQIVANGELYPGEFDDPLAAEGSDKE